jgi:hypothetical protein
VGIYQVTERVRGVDLQGAFTINLFDATQSQLAPAKALPILHSTNFTPTGNNVSRELREIWPWIAAFLLLILCFEWWLFSSSYRHQTPPAKSRQGSDQRGFASGRRKRNTFTANIQDQLQERYRVARKRFLKVTRQTRSKLMRQTSKGDRNANI